MVTVSTNPTVDQLAAAIGFTLVLNAIKKHGTAVFSGEIPSTLEFLQPDKTIEKNTDSLRDFIIALDKAKADKLRYKIEDKYVKIFITPYRTSIDEKDLEFSQGDFNVEVVLALGVKKKEELDQAITAHGRILHDATVININIQPGENIGGLNWNVPAASSYSEVLVNVADLIRGDNTNIFDAQTATAFLTGIVAETDRFSNDKTSPQTMNMASILMKAGANQQLIATKLEEPKEIPPAEPVKPAGETSEKPAESTGKVESAVKPVAIPAAQKVEKAKPNDGALNISHDLDKPVDVSYKTEGGETASPTAEKPVVEEIHIDEQGILSRLDEMEGLPKASSGVSVPNSDAAALPAPETPVTEGEPMIQPSRHILNQPPSGSDLFTAVTGSDSGEDAPPSELNLPSVNGSILSHGGHATTGKTVPELPVPDSAAASDPVAQQPEPASKPTDSMPLDLNGDGESEDTPPSSSSGTAPPPIPPPLTPPAAQPPAGPSVSQQANAQAL